MKGQGIPSHRQSSEKVKIFTGGAAYHSFDAEDIDNQDSNSIELHGLPGKVRPRTRGILSTLTTLGISEEALRIGQPLQALLAKELSCSRYFRWAFVDNFVEKILQGLILNKQDVSQTEINFCKSMIRQVPNGRSLLLHQACGLRKMYAARGFVLTTEMVLTEAVKAFITVSLSYRLYNWSTTGDQNFSEFTTLFDDNTRKGASSLARLLLSSFDPKWLYLLLASPAIAGALKGLWDTRKSQLLTEHAITQLQEAVDYHTNTLLKKSYLWGEVLRQLIPMPGFSSVSERVQSAEQQIRWDGRITNQQRSLLFSNIEKLAFQGSGMSQINAMQSLAKIVHSLSIKDFHRLQQAGYPQETLVQILRIKTQALRDLRTLSNRARVHVQPQEVSQNPAPTLNQSRISTLYATYLLWWLGMGKFKHSPLFWSFKFGKLALEGLFLKGLVESILDIINCPDKKGFQMFFGTFERWSEELTPDCFYEFVRQFRTIYKDEPFSPFLEQLSKFDLRTVDLIDLSNKALTSNQTIEILNILNQRQSTVKNLSLSNNRINDTLGLLLPNSLQSLDLSDNNLSAEGTKGFNLPTSLKTLYLSGNNLGDEGVKGLNLPTSLQDLYLANNNLSAEGTKGFNLPTSLKTLYLSGNNLGDEGVKGLNLPTSLQSLDLSFNNLSAEGAQGIHFPTSLKNLYLEANNLGDEGAKGLNLPTSLQSLALDVNNISAEGVQGIHFPTSLKNLFLGGNNLGDEGAKGLNLPTSLQVLYLWNNNISAEGVKGFNLPTSLQRLDLSGNNLGDEGVKRLNLSLSLRSLSLVGNNISAEGVKRLNLPPSLQSLDLGENNLGDEGLKGLNLPPSLRSLSLNYNNLSNEGVKGLNLPPLLQSLVLGLNNLGDEGVKGFNLPTSLQELYLWNNNISAEGAKGFNLPTSLQFLDLSFNNLGDEGVKWLQLPLMLKILDLSENDIGDEGVNALLQKIPKTKLTNIDLSGNLYNSTSINNVTRTLQQKRLLENCQRQLCYDNTLLSQQDEYQTSDAPRAQPPLFFSWLKKPFDKLSEYTSDCISVALDGLGTRLEKILSQSSSYFPNIHSPDIHDWQSPPSGSAMLHQFKAGGSNTLLLSAPQTAIWPSLNTIAR